jgi:hypothetical protein
MMLEGLIPWPINLVDVMVLVRMTEMGQYTALGLTPTIDRDYGPRSGDYDRNTDIELRKNKYKKNYALAPISLIGPYCEEDTFWTRKERADRELKIIKTKQEEVWKTQQEFTKVLLRMEKQVLLLTILTVNGPIKKSLLVEKF